MHQKSLESLGSNSEVKVSQQYTPKDYQVELNDGNPNYVSSIGCMQYASSIAYHHVTHNLPRQIKQIIHREIRRGGWGELSGKESWHTPLYEKVCGLGNN